MKSNKMKILTNGIIKENPVLVLVLGTCPTLAVTTGIVSAISMGLATLAVLVCSNIVISALRNIISDKIRIPAYIVIIAGFVTAVQMLLQAFLPDVYDMLGVYLALIVVNCIILGRAEMFANKNTVADSALDGVGMGIGFTLTLFLMGFVREVFGNATFAGIALPFLAPFKLPILTSAPGGFFVYGVLIALVAILTKGEYPKKKSFGCEGCPSASSCAKAQAGIPCESETNEESEVTEA